MIRYICVNCGNIIDDMDIEEIDIKCQYCGSRQFEIIREKHLKK